MKVLVIGGTNIDINAKSDFELLSGESNSGQIKLSIGGVAKNISENLVRLDVDVSFSTVLGGDYYGSLAYNYLQKIGLNSIIKRTKMPTPTYLAVFDNQNDLAVGINDMKALEDLNSQFIKNYISFEIYDIVVVDSNLSNDALEYIFEHCDKPIYAEAISAQKVLKFKPFLEKIEAIKCNKNEAYSLTGLATTENIECLIEKIYETGVKKVFITDGKNGSYYYDGNELRHKESIKTEVINTSGAGDAFFSGVIYATINQKDTLKYGNALAAITLASEQTNNPNLNIKLLESTVEKYEI